MITALKKKQANERKGNADILKDLEKSSKDMLEKLSKGASGKTAVGKYKEINDMLRKNIVTLDVYKEKLAEVQIEELNKKFKKGSIDAVSYNSSIKKIKDTLYGIDNTAKNKKVYGKYKELNFILSKGVITLKEYKETLYKIQLKELNTSFLNGKIHAEEYNDKLKKIIRNLEKLDSGSGVWSGIKKGARETIENIGTLADQISSVTSNAFNNLEDRLFDFVKTGKFEFRKFTEALLDDLTRVIIRMSIIKPLATAITGTGSTGGNKTPQYADNSQFDAKSAKGNIFNGGNVLPFAMGGVVNSPTFFPMANGTGLMGEAGPEAVMPLKRGKNGKLGVSGSGGGTVVNIFNNASNTETQTKESTGPNGERQIDVLITSKVGEAIGDGKFDKLFNQVYGLNRKGA